MTQLPWSIANWLYLIWIINPILAFVVSLLAERHLRKKQRKGCWHLLPVLIGIAASLLVVLFTSLLQNDGLTMQIFACAVIAAAVGNLLGLLIFCPSVKFVLGKVIHWLFSGQWNDQEREV